MKGFLKVVAGLLAFLLVLGFLITGSLEGAVAYVGERLFFWMEEETSQASPDQQVALNWEPSPPETVPEYQDPARIGYNMGQCASLLQDVHVVAFFLDDHESRWTPESASAFARDTIRPALDFVEKQAGLYGWELDIPLSLFYTGENHTIAYDGIFNDRFEIAEDGSVSFVSLSPPDHTQILQTVSECLGFHDYEAMHAQLQQQLGCRQIAYLIVSDKPGWNYSRVDTQANGYVDYEYSIVYSRYTDGTPCHPTPIAREVLHMFGGEYFSADPQGRANSLDLVCREYPNSIMLGNSYSLETNFVDGFTAYALGWRDTLPPEFLDQNLARIPQGWDEPFRPEYNQGSCRQLSGRPYLLNIYIDDDESCWDVATAENFQNKIVAPALSFLDQQAARWGVSLSMQGGMYVTDPSQGIRVRYQGIIGGSEDLSDSCADILDQAALSLGFSSKVDMHRFIQEFAGDREVILMLMINKPGRSYAMPDWDDDEGNTTECCLVFSRYWSTQEYCVSGTVAHELLHLYGAEDMYREESTGARAGREAVAKQLFPEDIMYQEFYNIQDNRIGAYTAYAIGWTDEVPYECTTDAFMSDE